MAGTVPHFPFSARTPLLPRSTQPEGALQSHPGNHFTLSIRLLIKLVSFQGHNKSIDTVAYHRSSNNIYTGSYDAVVTRWNGATGENVQVGGDGHKNAVVRLRFQGDSMFTVSMDDTLRVTQEGSDFSGEKVLLGGKPFGLAVAPRTRGLALTGTFEKKVLLVKNGQIATTKDVSYTPHSFAFAPDESEIAVGGDVRTPSLGEGSCDLTTWPTGQARPCLQAQRNHNRS